MANFEEAFAVVLSHEVFQNNPGKITANEDGRKALSFDAVPEQFRSNAVKDSNGHYYYGYTRTRYGVDERAHPELRVGGFYSSMPDDKALAVAKNVFHDSWKFDQVEGQKIATKIFDAFINEGPGNALPVLQKALRAVGKPVLNWHWGPAMLQAVNACDEQHLVNAFCDALTSYYDAVARKRNMKLTPGGWLSRAAWGYVKA